jgi:hypothetical protein
LTPELLPSFACFLDIEETRGDSPLAQSLLFAQMQSRALQALDMLLRHPDSVATFLRHGLLPSLIRFVSPFVFNCVDLNSLYRIAQPSNPLKLESSSLDKLEEKAILLSEKCYEIGVEQVAAAGSIVSYPVKNINSSDSTTKRKDKGKEKGTGTLSL